MVNEYFYILVLHVIYLEKCSSVGKESPCGAGDRVWEDPLEKERATNSSILAWKTHGQRSLVGCSPWRRKESGTIE